MQHARGEPGRLAAGEHDALAGPADRRRHPRLGGQVGERHALGARERVVDRQRRVEHVGHERDAREAGVVGLRRARALHRHGDVELAPGEAEERLGRLGVGDEHRHAGRALPQAHRGRDDEPADRGRERADAHLADLAGGVRVEVRAQQLELGEDGVGVAEQDAGGGREADAAAVGLDELLADLALERGDLLGDGRGGEVERVGGGRDRAAVGELAQGAQAAQVDHQAQLTGRRQDIHSLLPIAGRTLRSVPTRHMLLAAAVATVWGVNFVVIHVGLGSFPPLLFAALRFVLMAFPAVFLVRRPQVPARWVIGVGAFIGAGQFGLLFVAMDEGMPAGLASLVLQLQAVFTIVLAVALLGERLRPAQALGAGIAFGGIALIGAGRAEGVPLLAVALCVAAAASWGAGNICTRVAQAPDAVALLVWSSLVPPLPLLGLSLDFEGPDATGDAFATLDPGGVLALLYVVVLSTAFGFGVWTWLLRQHPASKVAPFTLLVPVVGIAAAWIALGEVPTVAEMAGAVVVLAGLALTTNAVRVRRVRPAVAAPEGARAP